MNNKKIALFGPYYGFGGAGSAFVNLAKGFIGENIEIDLLIVDEKYVEEKAYFNDLPNEIKKINLNASIGGRCMGNVLEQSILIFNLASYLRKERPHILISGITKQNISALIARYLSGFKDCFCILSQHDILFKQITNQKRIKPYLIRKTYPYADKIVAVSKGVLNDLKRCKITEKKLTSIYNALDIPKIQALSKESFSTTGINFFNKKSVTLISVGRLTEEKDYPTLIRSFALIRKQIDANLVILGEGRERKKIQKLAKKLEVCNNLWMPGAVNNPHKYVSKADVFVLSSQWEGFGNVIVEALAVGTPIVSTDCHSGPAEILENGKWGKLVPVGNARKMTEAVIKTLQENIDSMQLKSRANDFNLKSITYKYIQLINKLS